MTSVPTNPTDPHPPSRPSEQREAELRTYIEQLPKERAFRIDEWHDAQLRDLLALLDASRAETAKAVGGELRMRRALEAVMNEITARVCLR